MQIPNYIAIIVALILSLSISFLQYFYKEKYAVKNTVLLFCLRSFSIFLLLLLLFNPTINKVELQTIKPVLSVLVDNSQSILFLKIILKYKTFFKNIKIRNQINHSVSKQP